MIGLPNPKLLICVLVTAFLTVFPAYHFAVINVADQVFQDFINETFISAHYVRLTEHEATIVFALLVTSYTIGSIFGTLSTAFFAEKWGRRFSMMVINNVGVIIASVLMSLAKVANSFPMLIIGRALAGYCTGLAYGLLAIYLTEISPLRFRGFNASCQNLMLSFNTLMTLAIALPQGLGNSNSWIVLLGFCAPFAVAQILLTPFFPETPPFLLLKKGDEEAAKKSYRFFVPNAPDTEIEEAFSHYKKEVELACGKTVGIREALTTHHIRMPLLISIGCNIAAISTGIVVIFSYSTGLFKKIGFSESMSQYSSLIMSACNCMGAVVANFLMDRVGRRPLMLWGLIITTGCNIIFMSFSLVQRRNPSLTWPAYVSLVAIMIHVTVFNIGPGPITWFISSETIPQAARSLGATISITAAGLTQVLTNFSIPPIEDLIGPYAFLALITPTAILAFLLYFHLPETKNRPVDEIIEKWRSVRLKKVAVTEIVQEKKRPESSRHAKVAATEIVQEKKRPESSRHAKKSRDSRNKQKSDTKV